MRGIEVGVADIDLGRDGEALHVVRQSGHGFLDHETQKIPDLIGRLELVVFEDGLELTANFLFRDVRFRCWRRELPPAVCSPSWSNALRQAALVPVAQASDLTGTVAYSNYGRSLICLQPDG